MQTTEDKLKQIIFDLGSGPDSAESITSDNLLQYDLGIDSLAVIAMMAAIEETFDITISDDELIRQAEWMHTLGTVTAFVDQKLNQNNDRRTSIVL